MTDADTAWNVIEHGPIEKLDENLWRVQGNLPRGPLKRVMTVARLGDGRLAIHNAIALDPGEMAELEAFGRPALLIVPNGYHRIDAARFKARYPEMRVLCPRAATKRVAQVVAVDGDYGDPTAQSQELQLEHVQGTGDGEGVMRVHSPGGTTLVFNDILFNMPHLSGPLGWVLKNVVRSTGGPRVSRIARMFFLKDAAALRAHFERLAETPDLRRVIVSHQDMITHDPARVLREVAATL